MVDIDPVAAATGAALIQAIATDAWEKARDGAVALWRRVRPQQADAVAAELAEVREEVMAARRDGDTDAERGLVDDWQRKLQRLIRQDPAFAAELRRLLDDTLTPLLPPADQQQVGSITMTANAKDNARVYQAARDQHINEK
ncbi:MULTISPECIES: hypothetical protein [unclassified Solwaraspora]|uniref:hypothetical protein n=1 Tax=unclassified Solwaraspora TaxID=2627926 RepID=UPI00248C6C04|nr:MULTISPECIES: hypothetical protein [unclassified Solwaraspora]WBB99577.1 hypothetical protein O7553_12190 [Solwaraspora sp. WMMA2059]WBC21872.1 hypothetical protein O7543_05180 [Solwaraspora sp. WMMA2080]WJK36081.1 hypothetical protein O7610_06940 [Solwaraspora sp. WMMA2065]